MSIFDEARCVGSHDLFDSTDMEDHALARDLCAGCPALTACAMLLREVQTETGTIRSSGGGPSGTWAGKLLGKHGYRTEYTVPNCGTDRGYYYHRGRDQTPCPLCRAAHSEVERKRVRRAAS